MIARLICILFGHDLYGYDPQVCGRCYRAFGESGEAGALTPSVVAGRAQPVLRRVSSPEQSQERGPDA